MPYDRIDQRRWHVHVGAHKTATTHLQKMLEALRPVLEIQGVGVATIEQIRPMRVIDLRRRRFAALIGRGVLRHEIETRLSGCVALHPRMILSEEDLLGNAGAPLNLPIYPRAEARIRSVASALLRNGRGDLWLSVRSADQFLPAAYATALKHGMSGTDVRTLRTRALSTPLDWVELVVWLRRAAPGVPITVWDHADYRQGARRILEHLTGVEIPYLPRLPDPPETRTPDADAIARAEALPSNLDACDRVDRVSEIYGAATGPRFSPFSTDEAAQLQDEHRRQLHTIRGLEGVRLIDAAMLA